MDSATYLESLDSFTLADSGFQLLRRVITVEQCGEMIHELNQVFSNHDDGLISSRAQRIVGGRNLQPSWRGWQRVFLNSEVIKVTRETLGEQFGLVRILFFDKPPGQSWNLSLHRDRTIAVAQHHDTPEPYSRPTVKAGVPHVFGDDKLLGQMLTLRLHLDPMHASNGPVTAVAGSHQKRDQGHQAAAMEIHSGAGDLFVMHPLLVHGSLAAAPGCTDHRRVVHLELAPHGAIESPYDWYQYDTIDC